jgi:GNAT superfamily N-acetyltransferase
MDHTTLPGTGAERDDGPMATAELHTSTAEPVRLRDGGAVVLRPMADDDGPRLVRFHESLSPESQYLRFFNAHAHLSDHEVTRFTHVDHVRRDAVVAMDGDDIVGVGRLDRTCDGHEAEVAFVVADTHQGRGVGTMLLRRVIERAAELGVERLVAETLLHNDRMLAVFRRTGLPYVSRFGDGVIHVTLTLIGRAAASSRPRTGDR